MKILVMDGAYFNGIESLGEGHRAGAVEESLFNSRASKCLTWLGKAFCEFCEFWLLWFLDTQVSLAPTHVQYNLHEPAYNLHEPEYNLHEPGYNLHEPEYNRHSFTL